MSRRPGLQRADAAPEVVTVVPLRAPLLFRRGDVCSNRLAAQSRSTRSRKRSAFRSVRTKRSSGSARRMRPVARQARAAAAHRRAASLDRSSSFPRMSSASEVLRIADIAIGIRYDDESLRRPLSETVRRFAVTSSAETDITITVDAMPVSLPPSGRLLFDSGAVWRAFDDSGGFRIDCFSDTLGDLPYKAAFFDRELRQGRILMRLDAVTDEMHALDYPLDEVMIAHLLGRGRGVELHGCGIIDRDGRGH